MLKITESKKRKWVSSSTRVGEHYLQDDEYEKLNTQTKPLLAHIITKYENRPTDSMNVMESLRRQYFGDFLFLGMEALPLAVETSQWGYDSHLALTEGTQLDFIERTLNRQAAQLSGLNIYNYFLDIPEAAVVVAVNTPNRMPEDVCKVWISMLVRRADELLLCVQNDRDWKTFLNQYKVEYIYEDGYTSWLRITS